MFKGLGGLGNMASLLGNLGKIKERGAAAMAKLAETRVTGTAAGGAVEVEATGHGEVVGCRIAPAVFAGDHAEAERLITEACRDAVAKAKEVMKAEMKSAAEDVDLPPGLAESLGKLTGAG